VTRRVFRGEWLRTGDVYARDADGYYTCLGRSDDVLKVAGMWVSAVGGRGPAACPSRRRAGRRRGHPGCRRAGQVGGLRGGARRDQPTAQELIDFCRAGLSAFRAAPVLFLPEFPLTATGKIQRFRLREHALTVLSAAADRSEPVPRTAC